jgi:AcrR family transcriptional regulator
MVRPDTASARRTDALSKDRVIEAAIAILDADPSSDWAGLTVRSVMARLQTGSGAIYHHVATMDELRASAADEVLRPPLERIRDDVDPDAALQAVAVAIFEVTQAHPWIGAQLTRSALQPATVRIWRTIGAQLERMGLGGAAAATAGSTLTNYVLGSVVQFGDARLTSASPQARAIHLEAMARELEAMDGDPLSAEIATQLREHDDVRQFLDGVGIILRGIAAERADPVR